MTEEQLLEFRTILTDVKLGWAEIKGLPARLKILQDENTELKGGMLKLRKEVLNQGQRLIQPIRKHEVVTHDCASFIGSLGYIGAAKYNKLSHLSSHSRDLI